MKITNLNKREIEIWFRSRWF